MINNNNNYKATNYSTLLTPTTSHENLTEIVKLLARIAAKRDYDEIIMKNESLIKD